MYYHTSTVKQVNQLSVIFLQNKTQEDMSDFLEGILTPKEILELSQRIEIVKKLKAGIPQRQIAQEVGVGIATVSRGSREISRGKFAASWWDSTTEKGVL